MTSSNSLQEVVRVVTCPIDQASANLMLELAGGVDWTPTCSFDAKTKQNQLEVFLPPELEATDVIEQLVATGRLIGLELQPTIRELPRQDWQESWKAYFHVEVVSERFVICPTWESFSPQKDQLVIQMDPGMCFGTGQHGTTKGCLALLDRLERTHPELHGVLPGADLEVLDMGCGTGILAIGACKLGFKKVAGFDLDADCIGVSNENAALNKVTIPFTVAGVGHTKEKARIVMANILAPVLINFAQPIAEACRDYLIISGILESQYPQVLAAYVALGFCEVESIQLGEWRSATLTRDSHK